MTYRIVARSLRRSIAAALGIVLALGAFAPSTGGSPHALLPTTGTAYAAAPPTPAEVVLPFEAQMLTLVNADRAAQGLAPLKVDPALARIARWRSEDMATANYFSHDIGNVPGRLVFQVLQDQGVDYDAAG